MKRKRERFYAVKKGRETGIFNDWETAKSQIHRYSGCLYRGFDNEREAKEWLSYEPARSTKRVRTEPEVFKDDGSVLDIYVDGNHYKGTSSMGYGIYCKHEGKDYALRERVDADHMREVFGVGEDSLSEGFSNPTMELAAAIRVLILLCKDDREKEEEESGSVEKENEKEKKDEKQKEKEDEKGKEKEGKGRRFDLVRIYADYMGVKCWMEGTWRARKPIIKDLVKNGSERIQRISSEGIGVEFIWIKGHNGHEGNERSDSLSKGMDLEGALPLRTLL